MNQWMNECVDGWMDGWIDGCMAASVNNNISIKKLGNNEKHKWRINIQIHAQINKFQIHK